MLFVNCKISLLLLMMLMMLLLFFFFCAIYVDVVELIVLCCGSDR